MKKVKLQQENTFKDYVVFMGVLAGLGLFVFILSILPAIISVPLAVLALMAIIGLIDFIWPT